MDPVGNVPIFITVLKDIKPKRQRFIIIRELFFALIVIVLFNFLGEVFLDFLGVEQHTIMIAGGIILFIIALNMIFPTHRDKTIEIVKEKEPLIVPLAIPLVAGPAVLAAVILYSHQQTSFIMISAITLAWVVSLIILLCASLLKKLLGARGIMAVERLMGLLLTLIAVQMFLEGITKYMGLYRT